ncbi:MAG: cysteine-rich CWC family protein [Bacteroidota bacterium]
MTSTNTPQNTKGTQKTCPRCGKAFFCGAETGSCWCTKYSLSENALQKLQENYSGCLCEACLSTIAENQHTKLS